jgi:hypothetical protein
MDEVKFFQVVENEWREAYDREWGYGLVTSVDQGDGRVWVTKIEKDDDGYFLAPEAVIRHKSRLRPTSKTIKDISITFADPNPHLEQEESV